MDPVVLESARKHGISDGDTLHAYRNPTRVFVMDDLVMLVRADEAGPPHEVGVAETEGLEFIVRAMPARQRLLR